MPREQINYPDFTRVESGEPDPTLPPIHGVAWIEPAVHVSWSPTGEVEGHVQVALEVDQRYMRHMLNGATTADVTPTMYSPALTRAELNKLIRTLRNARDKAYGRDE